MNARITDLFCTKFSSESTKKVQVWTRSFCSLFRWDFSLDIWAAASCDAECWSCHNWNCNLIFWPNHARMKALGTRRIRVRNLWRKEHRAGKTREQQHNEARVMKENERWARACVCKTSIQKTRKWCLKRPKTATNTPPPPPRSASWGFMWCFLGFPSN